MSSKYEQNRAGKNTVKRTLDERINEAQVINRQKYLHEKSKRKRKKYNTPEYMSNWVSQVVWCIRKNQLSGGTNKDGN